MPWKKILKTTAILMLGIAWFGLFLPYLISAPSDIAVVIGLLLGICSFLVCSFFGLQWVAGVYDKRKDRFP